jgi:adenosylhomocysteine nucleosidase
MNGSIAIVAALPREVAPLVKGWQRCEGAHRIFLWKRGNAVVACAGIGATRAALACEAVMKAAPIATLISAGLAGACDPSLRVGDVVRASIVIDAKTGERFESAFEDCNAVVVTGGLIASVHEKQRLHQAYGASAVDMEASTVARIACAHNLEFRAVKAISDEADFAMEGMERFVTADGHFREVAFAMHSAIRPHTWARVIGLGRNSSRATRALTEALSAEID